MTLLRWMLVPLAVLSGLLIAGLLSLLFLEAAGRFCLPAKLDPLSCTDWLRSASNVAALSVGTAMGAWSAVVLPALVAPSQKMLVASLALTFGSIVAVLVAFHMPASIALVPAVSAVIAGAAAAMQLRTMYANAA
jgi:hypothetical protein